MNDFTPLRSVLYMPSSNAKALEKAKTLPVDGIILDLEDAVAPDDKPSARDAACAAVTSGAYGRRTLTIRVNGVGSEWHAADLVAAAAAGPDAVVVPKVSSADQVRGLATALDWAGAPERTKLWAMIETPEAIFNAREIAGCLRAADRAGDGHQRPRQGAVRRARARPAAAPAPASASRCSPPAPPAR